MSGIERVESEPAFVLHARPYRETSQIADVISQNHGRVGVVANGARRQRSKWKLSLRPFQPLLMSWAGRRGLYTLRGAERTAPAIALRGAALMSAFYVNELILALTDRDDPHPELFAHYGGALAALSEGVLAEQALRRFELSLLTELGYGLIMDHDVDTDQPLVADRKYRYVVDRGPIPVDVSTQDELVFTGADLGAIAAGVFASSEQLKGAKRLLRAVLHRRLGGRSLKSRTVYASMRRWGSAGG